MDDLWRGAFAGVCLVQSDHESDLVEPACGAHWFFDGAVQPDPAGGGKPEGITFQEFFEIFCFLSEQTDLARHI